MPALASMALTRAAVVIALCAAGLSVSASEQGPAAEPASSTAPKRPRDPSPDVVREPLDMLRERLARRLGARKAPGTANPDVVQVIAKANTPVGAPVGAAVPDHPPATERKRLTYRKPATTEPVHATRATRATHAARTAHWEYAGDGGPLAWGRITPESLTCATGMRQSPNDIRDGIKVELDPIRFDYKPGGFRVIDTGHTVQVNLAAGNAVEVQGRRYELLQFHFHRPSEERVDGRQFEMVVHLVHKDLNGRLAVVAVLLDRGAAQAVVQSVWNNLPLEKGEEVAARSTLDPSELLPPERRYFTYMGSLTTPPCSEGVLWMVMKQPVAISAEQIDIFARLYPMNARPIQPTHGRLIKESN